MIRRPPRSTPKPSSAASDVYKRQVPLRCSIFFIWRSGLTRGAGTKTATRRRRLAATTAAVLLLRCCCCCATEKHRTTSSSFPTCKMSQGDAEPTCKISQGDAELKGFVSAAGAVLLLLLLHDPRFSRKKCSASVLHVLHLAFWFAPGFSCLLYTSPSPRD